MKKFDYHMCAMSFLGSARLSRVGDGVLAIADFSFNSPHPPSDPFAVKARFGGTPKLRQLPDETRALPNLLN
jgi:hypothetical protein